MSLINHIIIPVVGSRQNLQEQNVFKHACLTFTPQKGHPLSEPILWKKSMSAFKKFKQKKDKKDKKVVPNSQEESVSHFEKQEGKVKLITKTKILPNNQQLDQSISTLAYYDPNEAPLYEFNADDLLPSATPKQLKSLSKCDSGLLNLGETKMLKVESEVVESQNQIFFSVEPRPDDAFIIVRKGNLKKSTKYVKPKSFKKQKWEKGCTKDEEEHPSPLKRKLQSHCSSMKHYEDKGSDRQSSQQELLRHNRQIFTLSEIMKSAFEQKAEELCKSAKQKEPVMRELSFAEDKPKNDV